MNMKLSSKSLEKTKKMREVTEVKGQREQTVETDHVEIGIMTEIGKSQLCFFFSLIYFFYGNTKALFTI